MGARSLLLVEAKQEAEMIYREQVEQLQVTFGQLSDQERLLDEILRSEAETEEIALALRIDPQQVRKRKYKLIRKIRKRLAEGDAETGKKCPKGGGQLAEKCVFSFFRHAGLGVKSLT